MLPFEYDQQIKQLDKRRGGYYYVSLDAEIVNQFDRKRATRLLCTLDAQITYSCGLNHLGDGNFFVIIATKYLKSLGKLVGDFVSVRFEADPNPLGVEVPEVLEVLLAQDASIKASYDQLTDGKKRSLIYSIIKVKNVDKQVQKILAFFEGSS